MDASGFSRVLLEPANKRSASAGGPSEPVWAGEQTEGTEKLPGAELTAPVTARPITALGGRGQPPEGHIYMLMNICKQQCTETKTGQGKDERRPDPVEQPTLYQLLGRRARARVFSLLRSGMQSCVSAAWWTGGAIFEQGWLVQGSSCPIPELS